MLYKITIAYEGTHYHGWQIQPNGVSIQAIIEETLQTVSRQPVKIIGSGRTDAGVHALGQVAHFHLEKALDIERVLFSLNSLLPKDIRIISLEAPAAPFHAQHHAQSKIYRYHLYLDKVLNPFRRAYVWHIPAQFKREKLLEASRYLLGTHDFTSFSNEAHKGVAAKDPIRTIHRIDIIEEEGGIALEFEGDGFLYKMVRNMVGLLVDCAIGKKEPSEIPEILKAKNRTKGSMAAPAQGLFLVKVLY
jgi:tRNA pseudouridine38-40 synthase